MAENYGWPKTPYSSLYPETDVTNRLVAWFQPHCNQINLAMRGDSKLGGPISTQTTGIDKKGLPQKDVHVAQNLTIAAK